jgi:hypothetical protein
VINKDLDYVDKNSKTISNTPVFEFRRPKALTESASNEINFETWKENFANKSKHMQSMNNTQIKVKSRSSSVSSEQDSSFSRDDDDEEYMSI